MTTKTAVDPLGDAINSAVRNALAEHLKPLIDELRNGQPALVDVSAATGTNAERFVSMTELCNRLSINRTTALRRERMGKIPQRREFPDGRLGWSSSDIDAWFAAADLAERDPGRNAALAARIHKN